MYRVVFMRDKHPYDATRIGQPFANLADALHIRELSGDVVVDRAGVVVQDDAWLWDWERADPSSYAYKHVTRTQPAKAKVRTDR